MTDYNILVQGAAFLCVIAACFWFVMENYK